MLTLYNFANYTILGVEKWHHKRVYEDVRKCRLLKNHRTSQNAPMTQRPFVLFITGPLSKDIDM